MDKRPGAWRRGTDRKRGSPVEVSVEGGLVAELANLKDEVLELKERMVEVEQRPENP